MSDDTLSADLQAAIDKELHYCLDQYLEGYPTEYCSMLKYQLGWEGEQSGQDAQGKRIRPLIVLLACHACGGDWRKVLPSAAAIELVHNFSLIHDDIQDCSKTRRGRPTVWVKWGEAQAINAGDAMLTIAQLSILKLEKNFSPSVVIQAVNLLQSACLKLTRGQFLDIAFENQDVLPLDFYLQMIEGKTGALLSACLGLGALGSQVEESKWRGLMDFGSKIGAAFQVQDDWLGIWGSDEVTGKSTISDLVSKKKTYPVLLGLQAQNEFQKTWCALSSVSPEEAIKLAELLENEGYDRRTQQKFETLYSEAFALLDSINLDSRNMEPLKKTIKGLFDRKK